MTNHKSDCAVHNEPAMKAGSCDCGADHPIVEAVTGAICGAYDKRCTDCDPDYPKGCGCAQKAARAALTAAQSVLAENLLDKTAMQQIDDALGHANREADRLLLNCGLSQNGTPPSSPGELP